MRETFTRFLFYLFLTIIISGPFRSSWPDPSATEPLAVKLSFYFTHYGIGWLFWTLLLLSVHEAVKWTRRRLDPQNAPTTQLDAPETNRLEPKP